MGACVGVLVGRALFAASASLRPVKYEDEERDWLRAIAYVFLILVIAVVAVFMGLMRLNNRATVRVVVSHDDLSIPLLANPDIYGLSCPCKSPLTLRQIMLGCGTQTCNTTELAFDAYAWEATFTEQCIETCIDLGHDTTDDVCASIALSVMSTFALAQFSSYRPKVQMEQIVLYNYQASFDNGVFNARDSAFMLSLVNETIGKDVNATAYCVMDNPELMIPISVDWTLLDSQFFYACDMDECSWDALETLISVFFATLAIVGTVFSLGVVGAGIFYTTVKDLKFYKKHIKHRLPKVEMDSAEKLNHNNSNNSNNNHTQEENEVYTQQWLQEDPKLEPLIATTS